MGGCPPTTPGGGGTASVTVTIAPANSGTVAQSASGNEVTLEATANTNFKFDHWSGATLTDPTLNPITVDATQIPSLTANFTTEQGPGSPADRDHDGVPDATDHCPDTPAGAGAVDANGCAASERDADGDGVPDSIDTCPGTPTTVTVDANGCPVSAPGTPDDDADGVPNDIDQCPNTAATTTVDANGCAASQRDSDGDGVKDNLDQCPDTPTGATVDANGCAPSQLDSDGDRVTDNLDLCPNTPARTPVDANGCPITGGGGGGGGGAVCGNHIVEAGEQCDDGNTVSGDGCSSTCQNETPAVCGNGMVEAGEQCDDGNTTSGDGCSSTCQMEGTAPANDSCANAIAASDGTVSFSTNFATTDGPDEPATCNFFANSQVNNDIWYVYTATCSGPAVFSLCGSEYDTKLAVYNGSACPTDSPLACNDDGCGTGVERVESRVTLTVTSGQQYLVRVGGYVGARGNGQLTIACNVDNCALATTTCFSASPTHKPGCSDATCCHATCALDTFCCDVIWDDFCAGEASGVCTGNFPACAAGAGDCGTADGTPGCQDAACCNKICASDPYCCLTDWDANCVSEAQSGCFLTCNSRAGDCLSAHTGAGCSQITCCQAVCPTDPFCCDTEWDPQCVDKANTLCH